MNDIALVSRLSVETRETGICFTVSSGTTREQTCELTTPSIKLIVKSTCIAHLLLLSEILETKTMIDDRKIGDYKQSNPYL